MKKRLLLLLLFVPISMFLAAQTDNPHLTFKGIPIDGELNLFISKLKNEGFTVYRSSDGTDALLGEFASYKDCTIIPNAVTSRKIVNRVGVALPFADNWATLSARYYSLKTMLIKKYGNYSRCTENFQTGLTDLDNSFKTALVLRGNCTYETVFSTPKGDITLAIGGGTGKEATVMLFYQDKINSELGSDKAMDDL